MIIVDIWSMILMVDVVVWRAETLADGYSPFDKDAHSPFDKDAQP